MTRLPRHEYDRRARLRARGIEPPSLSLKTPLARARRRLAAGIKSAELEPDELEAIRAYNAAAAASFRARRQARHKLDP